MKNKFYVYVHKRKDNDKIFYVGKGSNRRYLQKGNRSQKWKNYVNKYGYNSEILFYFDTEEEAFKREQSLILTLKNLGYKLANISSGGEGGQKGNTHSSLTKQKMSIAHKGKHTGVNNNAFKSKIKATNIFTNEEFIFIGPSELDAFGFSNSCVYMCLTGKRKTHKNFIFQRT